jgi:tannase
LKSLDGKIDGVVARSDLCKLHFNTNTGIGKAYYCSASSGSTVPAQGKRQMASAPTPAQNGTVTAKGVAVANKIIDGLHDLNGH